MGVAYNVISAGAVHRYRFAVEALSRYDMVPPAPTQPGRNPSPQELRAVLDDLPGYAVSYAVNPGNWQAEVEATSGFPLFRANTLLCVVEFQGDEALPHLFYFDGGDARLNLLIAERLSRQCGPLYLFPDTGARPLLVTPGLNPADGVKGWQRG
jgi:hypothetical protein